MEPAIVAVLDFGNRAFALPNALGSERFNSGELNMKKLVLALSAVAAFSAPALAADMAAKAPMMPAPVAAGPSWTGCYVGAGWGYGMTNNESYLVTDPSLVRASTDLTQGGRGWLATVQGGCDYQFGLGSFGNRFVVGAFVDGDWTNIRGNDTGDQPLNVGLAAVDTQTLNSQWAVGARAGYLITPQLLTYVSGGYSQANFSGATYRTQGIVNNVSAGALTGDHINSQTYNGWFIGTGDEYALSFLPGLFWKTEYRFTSFDSKDVPVLFNTTGLSNGFRERTHFYEQSVRSELVYRFNWGGPVVAKY
jgi:outer membrane immunogenic protein